MQALNHTQEHKLNIFEDVVFDDVITKLEYHSYQPYATSTFNADDEIRIPITSSDIYTLPHESYISIEGSVTSTDNSMKLVNNAYAFLFDEIRYEINGVSVDRCRDPGITSTLKNLATMNQDELSASQVAGWALNEETKTRTGEKFNACIPLKLFMGFFEMYNKILINCKQELILLRSRNNNNVIIGKDAEIKITKLQWHMPHVNVNDEVKLKMLRNLNADKSIVIPYRKWELHELPQVKQIQSDSWQIRTTTQLEKPRYVLVAFQEERRNKIDKDASNFDHATLRNIKLFLNSEGYPYDKQDLNFGLGRYATVYYDYSTFQKSYYGEERVNSPILNFESFKNNPIFVIDCSKQNESIKSSTVDVKLEFEAVDKFPAGTVAYCLIIHDAVIEYNPVTGFVHKLL